MGKVKMEKFMSDFEKLEKEMAKFFDDVQKQFQKYCEENKLDPADIVAWRTFYDNK